jgi:uncharacterized protein YndB with AHSA1/START domain
VTGAASASDEVRAEVHVRVPCELAFELFTTRLDVWWRRGVRYRSAGAAASLMHLEPGVGGRLFENIGGRIVEVGRVTAWQPPHHVAFTWRSTTFTREQHTEVCVHFEVRDEGTQVRVVHRGWAAIPGDHPVRHGQASTAFLRGLGLWWGDLLASYRLQAHGQAGSVPD